MASGSYTSVMPDPPTAARSFALLEAQPEPVFYIVDLLDATFDFQGMLEYANSQSLHMASRHPKVKQLIVLTKDPIIQMAAAGLNSDAFGNIEVPVFERMDQAVAYIHNH
jgi:hypothetical protein